MTNMQEIAIECFEERIEHCLKEIKNLRKEKFCGYDAYLDRVQNMIAELQNDIEMEKETEE